MNKFVAQWLERGAPIIFVLLWSTGFIGGKMGVPYAESFTFLSIRFAIVLLILVPIVAIFVRVKVKLIMIVHCLVAGILIHGLYLGGVFYAIEHGMPAGIAALIMALQPLITAYLAWQFLNEKITRYQLVALLTALIGVGLVIAPKILGVGDVSGITITNLISAGIALLGITIGSVYQKQFVQGLDVRFVTMVQFIGASIPMVFCALLFETGNINWTGEFIFALVWLVLVLSIGAVLLLLFLIGRDSVSKTASLFYLVPVCTSVMAYFLFDEKLQVVQLIGMVVVVASVALGSKQAAKR